jgi:hypothetical protein
MIRPKFRTAVVERVGLLFRCYVIRMPGRDDVLLDKALIDLHPEGPEIAISDEIESFHVKQGD